MGLFLVSLRPLTMQQMASMVTPHKSSRYGVVLSCASSLHCLRDLPISRSSIRPYKHCQAFLLMLGFHVFDQLTSSLHKYMLNAGPQTGQPLVKTDLHPIFLFSFVRQHNNLSTYDFLFRIRKYFLLSFLAESFFDKIDRENKQRKPEGPKGLLKWMKVGY